MKDSLKITGIGLLAVAGTSCTQQKTQRPNIVYILSDDLGMESLGCYGGTSYETPYLDALANQGIRFENMHSLPLSCPSRVQSLTGIYNDRNYVNFGYINDDENTFAHLAQQAGYATAMVGKWQLGCSRDIPTKLGFDEWCLVQLEMYKEFDNETHTDRYANTCVDNNRHYELSLYGPDTFQDYAIDFIDRQAEAGKPFLLYYTTPLVHKPHTLTPDSEAWDLDYFNDYKNRCRNDVKNYPDMVKYLDKQVGELAQHLKEKGLWDNTIFIFTSDNGTCPNVTSQMSDGRAVRGGKGTSLWTATHVPLIICWGDKIKEGRTSKRLVDLTDFTVTFADAMGITPPAEWKLDGISLYPELCGEKPLERELTLIHHNPLWPLDPSPLAARYAMTPEYKYYWDGRFYNYIEDPDEQHPIDVNNARPEIQTIYAKLKAKVDEYPDWYPDKPGAERHGNYKSFYDFAPRVPFWIHNPRFEKNVKAPKDA